MSHPLRLSQLRVRNLLSFGPDADWIEVQPLNVLIGPNASGKSNLLDALSLLQSLPDDLTEVIREGGGIHEWLWKGPGGDRIAEIEVRLDRGAAPSLRHRLRLGQRGARLVVTDERIETWETPPDWGKPVWYFGHDTGHPMVLGPSEQGNRTYTRVQLRPEQSILAQRNDPEGYPEFADFQDIYAGIRIYRDWTTGRGSAFRVPQPADLPDDFLLPSARNLAILLSAFQRFPKEWDTLHEAMRRFHPGFKELKTIVQGGTVQLFLREIGLDDLVPATRLSDGTLRYLALLSVLLHPTPPRVVCIEEPELGLHPDLVDDLARLLVDASARCQLVVTTHSDHLVNALSDVPTAVLVTERGEQGTVLRRLEQDNLATWLEKYRLGELWMRGELGGTRW